MLSWDHTGPWPPLRLMFVTKQSKSRAYLVILWAIFIMVFVLSHFIFQRIQILLVLNAFVVNVGVSHTCRPTREVLCCGVFKILGQHHQIWP